VRNEPNLRIDKYRGTHPVRGESEPGANYGYFVVERHGVRLSVISSGVDVEHGWEHVSVSHPQRCPTWDEMQFVKELFWKDDEVVIQYHPAKKDYVNVHGHCLHMWRPLSGMIPMPPVQCV